MTFHFSFQCSFCLSHVRLFVSGVEPLKIWRFSKLRFFNNCYSFRRRVNLFFPLAGKQTKINIGPVAVQSIRKRRDGDGDGDGECSTSTCILRIHRYWHWYRTAPEPQQQQRQQFDVLFVCACFVVRLYRSLPSQLKHKRVRQPLPQPLPLPLPLPQARGRQPQLQLRWGTSALIDKLQQQQQQQ